jgi:hypothetical protein
MGFVLLTAGVGVASMQVGVTKLSEAMGIAGLTEGASDASMQVVAASMW